MKYLRKFISFKFPWLNWKFHFQPGGISRIDVYQPGILKFVDLARKEYSESRQTTYEPIIIEVSKATSQIVSGTMYRINLTFAASSCRKGIKNCAELEGGRVDKCTFEVWSQPWIDHGSPKHKLICENSL